MEDKLDVARPERIVGTVFKQEEQEPARKGNGTDPAHRKRRGEKSERERFWDLRERAFDHVVRSSNTVLGVALVIVLLQGFHLWDFDLPKEILYALLVATIGKVAESLIIVMRFLFGSGPPSE